MLDCFSGSGTTLDVASQLGRQWIGIDNSAEAIATTLRRFAQGLEPMGDFVSSRKASLETRDDLLKPTLFPFQESAEKALTKHLTGNTCPSFSLYATEPYGGELDSAVEQW